MPVMWGVDMSKVAAERLKMHMTLTPALEAQGWRDIETAPRDGTEVELRVVHINAAYEPDAEAKGWVAACPGKWIEHNGGGWTWKYLCGSICQWRPGNPGAFDNI